VVPGLLDLVPAEVSKGFGSTWAPVQALQARLHVLPAPLLWFWAEHERGHVLIGPDDLGYIPGLQRCGQRTLDCVAHVSLQSLAAGGHRPLVLVGHLIDHLLGCHGEPDGRWLSAGGGVCSHWRDVGRQVAEFSQLGYGRAEVANQDPTAYFAQGLADWCHDRVALNVADPLLEKLLSRTVMNPAFWATGEGECVS
jgi:hypothetical protein